MRVIWLTIWLSLIYLSSSLVFGDVLKHAVIIKNMGDRSFAAGHIEWAIGIFISVLYVWTKPLFYSWRRLAEPKSVAIITTSIVWPVYLIIVGALILILRIDWQEFVRLWQYPAIWLWILVASDPTNTLGQWVDESDFWQSHIETWRSFGTLNWLYREYPPKSAGDVAGGLISMTIVTLIAPLIYWLRS